MEFAAAARLTQHSLQIQSDGAIVSFDRTGRFVRLAQRSEVVRRTLDGTLLRVTNPGGGALRAYEALTQDESEELLTRAYAALEPTNKEKFDGEITDWAEKAKSWFRDALLHNDARQFREAYLPVSILPPGEYQSVVVQLAEGCSYNRCLFCDFYRDRPFHIKNREQLEVHLSKVRRLFGARLRDRSGIFLGDGNALVIPTEKLLRAMTAITTSLPEVAPEFSTFMDTFNLSYKSHEDLVRIRERGLETVYVGLESGHDSLRAMLKKPGSAQDALAGIQKLKVAGFKLGIIVLAGVGSHEQADAHFRDTAILLQKAGLEKRDLVFVSPFVEPKQTLYSSVMEEIGGTPFSTSEAVVEAKAWIQRLRQLLAAKVSFYSILEHFY